MQSDTVSDNCLEVGAQEAIRDAVFTLRISARPAEEKSS